MYRGLQLYIEALERNGNYGQATYYLHNGPLWGRSSYDRLWRWLMIYGQCFSDMRE